MSDNFFQKEYHPQTPNSILDFKRVIARALRFWYLVLFSLITAFVLAFYKNRYTERVYPITASLIIRETQEIGGAELLYRNVLIDQYRNYLNEPYIIRSLPLLEQVVKKRFLFISFYREGRVVKSEAYDYVPVKMVWFNTHEMNPDEYVFTLLDSLQYTISLFRETEKEQVNVKFYLGDTVSFHGNVFCIDRIQGRNWQKYVGVPFIMIVQVPRDVAASYSSRLNVKWAEAGAGVITLSITGSNRTKEVDFLNELIQTYQEKDLDKKNEAATRTIEFIGKQLVAIKDSLRTVELKLEKFGVSSRMKDLSVEAQKLFSRIDALEVQRTELLIRQNYLKYLEDNLKQDKFSFDQIILPSSLGINEPVLNSTVEKMINLQTEIRAYSDPERKSNPIIEAKALRLLEIKKEIESAVQSLKTTDKIKLDYLDNLFKNLDAQLKRLPSSERQLITIQRNYSLLENLYVFLMQKLSEASISKAANTSDIILVNPPVVGSPIMPRPVQNYLVACLLGLLTPFLSFVLIEILNNKVQSKEDIEKMTTVPFIGGVGHNNLKSSLIVKERPKSGIAESFRALRSNLIYFTENRTKQVFMITSSISGEGKTFTSVNLASVFALSGKKTVIVGADMRRPKIFDDFNCSNEVGLSTYLSGLNTFDQIVQNTMIDNLYLISGGPIPPNPSELLLTEKFQEFIKSAIDRFDFVIIDTPPLALVTDAFVISKFADHTIFVLRQNFTPKQFIRSIDEYYRSGKIKSISILLNDIYKSGLGYGYGQGYFYHYGYAYGYGYSGKKKNGNSYYED